MKTSELTGHALDWAVAVALGMSYWTRGTARWGSNDGYTDWILDKEGLQRYYFDGSRSRAGHWEVIEAFRPSTDGALAVPIIEQERITMRVSTMTGTAWVAFYDVPGQYHAHIREKGPTMLIAAMRCFVASKLGGEVDLPKELL